MKRLVLLVDDEPMLRQLRGDALLDSGIIAIPASNGADAISIIESKLYQFDLWVSDVKMPGSIDGLAVADQFQARYPSAGVIMISGHIDSELAVSLTTERYRILPKPVRFVNTITHDHSVTNS